MGRMTSSRIVQSTVAASTANDDYDQQHQHQQQQQQQPRREHTDRVDDAPLQLLHFTGQSVHGRI